MISVHTLAFTQPAANRVVAGMMMLLQFGREVFFAISGFVLVYATRGRPLRLRRFWPRRYLYVAVPYVTWRAVYFGYSVLGPPTRPSPATFGRDLLYGGAEYHLYFLLVTMQLYLAFPLILCWSGGPRRSPDGCSSPWASPTWRGSGWCSGCPIPPAPGPGSGTTPTSYCPPTPCTSSPAATPPST